ncbi:MAG: hypothetical protein O2820_01620 [Planctomycetota bacterium]|nr:hypothetical protein [Planctomycetota bacterium]MDA1247897.1 hypothetical protein [Planctomycetota bacterium]
MAQKGNKRDGSKTQAVRDHFKANPGMGSKEVQAELEKSGVGVSLALVNKVKYAPGAGKKATKKSARKSTAKRSTAAKGRAGRPKSSDGASMSDQIRAYMAANPGASRPEIRAGLQGQGVDVKASLVNAVFIKVRKGGGKKAKPGRRPGRPAAAPSSALSAAELISAKQMIDKIGGIAKVREALGLLEQLQ